MTKRRLLIDTNVLMDVLGEREPFYPTSSQVWDRIHNGEWEGWISAHSVTTLYYLVRKQSAHDVAMRGIRVVMDVFRIAPVDANLIAAAVANPLGDFEDAVQHQCALQVGANAIVTRDKRHFLEVSIPVLTPAHLIGLPGDQ